MARRPTGKCSRLVAGLSDDQGAPAPVVDGAAPIDRPRDRRRCRRGDPHRRDTAGSELRPGPDRRCRRHRSRWPRSCPAGSDRSRSSPTRPPLPASRTGSRSWWSSRLGSAKVDRRRPGPPSVSEPDDVLVGAAGATRWWEEPEQFVLWAWLLEQRRPRLTVRTLWLTDASERQVWPLQHDIDLAGIDGAAVVNRPDFLDVIPLLDVLVVSGRGGPASLLAHAGPRARCRRGRDRQPRRHRSNRRRPAIVPLPRRPRISSTRSPPCWPTA